MRPETKRFIDIFGPGWRLRREELEPDQVFAGAAGDEGIGGGDGHWFKLQLVADINISGIRQTLFQSHPAFQDQPRHLQLSRDT
jgi:hypothetical protein